MGLGLSIDGKNSAFGGDHMAETVRILREAADRLEAIGRTDQVELQLRDINGNTVGAISYSEDWHPAGEDK